MALSSLYYFSYYRLSGKHGTGQSKGCPDAIYNVKHPDLLVSGTFSSVLSQRRAQQVPSILWENREGEKFNPKSGGVLGEHMAGTGLCQVREAG